MFARIGAEEREPHYSKQRHVKLEVREVREVDEQVVPFGRPLPAGFVEDAEAALEIDDSPRVLR